jgi:hypothetical protein
MRPHRRREQSVDCKHDEGCQHEDAAEAEHLRESIARSDGHELRQKREEEDRELGVENVDQDALDDHLRRRFRLRVGFDFQRTRLA